MLYTCMFMYVLINLIIKSYWLHVSPFNLDANLDTFDAWQPKPGAPQILTTLIQALQHNVWQLLWKLQPFAPFIVDLQHHLKDGEIF